MQFYIIWSMIYITYEACNSVDFSGITWVCHWGHFIFNNVYFLYSEIEVILYYIIENIEYIEICKEANIV